MQPVLKFFQHTTACRHRITRRAFLHGALYVTIHRRRAGKNNPWNAVCQRTVDQLLHRLQIKIFTRTATAGGQRDDQRIDIHQRIEIV
ncbi:hypothetical protein D3C73_1523270 [compost metagenome]